MYRTLSISAAEVPRAVLCPILAVIVARLVCRVLAVKEERIFNDTHISLLIIVTFSGSDLINARKRSGSVQVTMNVDKCFKQVLQLGTLRTSMVYAVELVRGM